jgi:2-oxo-4-hydroxy-4-carboxy--5-ureidoimidazoline (OHCU) decarboxylase
MLKNFLMKKMLVAKMKDVPAEERDKALAILEKHPDFFQKIAEEVQAEMKSGKDQMSAVMAVMTRHQEELKKIAQ